MPIWLGQATRSCQTAQVDRAHILKVGSIEMSVSAIGSELLAVFHEGMVQERDVPVRKYWPGVWPILDEQLNDELVVSVREYRVTGDRVADRLELMGFNSGTALSYLSGMFAASRALINIGLSSEEDALAGSLDGGAWVERLRASTDDEAETAKMGLSSRSWLLRQINDLDVLWRLRLILLALPEAEVVLDITEISDVRGIERLPLWGSLDAAGVLKYKASAYAPTVVLTEGKTDSEFLTAALAILYPHLTDLIRFLDYDRRPEGGVGALVQNIRAFSSAGIWNRIVAVFDNDTAAADALRHVDRKSFAPGIEILCYPHLELAEEYPTLGPPISPSSRATTSLTNINGLAGSIEIYLGRDVLTQKDGSLQPVQWTSFNQAMQRYQGEVTDKAGIHKRFRAKYKTALDRPETVRLGDWDGLRLILDAIRVAARNALYPPDED